jgi:deoxyribodipyrimidine photolyase
LRGVRFIPILNYVNFNKTDAMEFLEKNLGWRNYGRKHGESIFTRFFQEYYLPRKFNVDKRRSHLSSLICSGQLSRENALAQLQNPLLSAEEEAELVEFVCKKLGFSQAAWSEIMNAPPESHLNFRTSKLLSVRESRLYKYGRKVATGRDTL